MLRHRLHEQRAGDGAAERRRVEVAPARGLDVERAALQRGEALARERLAAVDEHGLLGAVEPRLLRHGGDVGLVVLPEIRGEGVRDRAVLAHPRKRAARVETAGERDADALADRQRAEDDPRERGRVDAHAAPRIDWARISSASSRARQRLARDEQHGVLARDRPRDVRMVRDVDRLGERARVPVRRRDDDEVPARLDRAAPSDRAQPRAPRSRASAARGGA